MEIPVFFNSDAVINGDLLFASDLHINCEIIGNVESEKKIVVGAEGFFKGTLKARELVVFGKLEGEIIVHGPTVLHPGSTISGTLSTQVIEIIDCAYLDIKVNILGREEASENTESKTAEIKNPFWERQSLISKTNSVIPEVKAINTEAFQQDDLLPEITGNNPESNEQHRNFLFNHFSETNLTLDSQYSKRFFEVTNDLNPSNHPEVVKPC